MTKTLVIKLLGRKIGYNVLWSKVCALWKLSQRFHIIDIENNYFLAKFESNLDYSNVLTKGPWVIYKHYLTVQPWTSTFSTPDIYP